MGRPIKVTIDSDDMIKMLYERVLDWENSVPYGARNLWWDFYEERVNDGFYDDMEDFDVKVIVDNDIVNYFSTFTRDEFISEFEIDPDDAEAMGSFMDYHYVCTDGEYFIVG